MKMGTAPAWITTRVWWDVPDAMLVSTHAASNWNNVKNIIPIRLNMFLYLHHTHTHTQHVQPLIFIGHNTARLKKQKQSRFEPPELSQLVHTCTVTKTSWENVPATCSFLSSWGTQQSAPPPLQWQWLHQWVGWVLCETYSRMNTGVILLLVDLNIDTTKEEYFC